MQKLDSLIHFFWELFSSPPQYLLFIDFYSCLLSINPSAAQFFNPSRIEKLSNFILLRAKAFDNFPSVDFTYCFVSIEYDTLFFQ